MNISRILEKGFSSSLSLLLFLLPWQTIIIWRETILDSTKIEYETIGFYGIEALLWGTVIIGGTWYIHQWRKRGHTRFSWSEDRKLLLSLGLFLLYGYVQSFFAPESTLVTTRALRLLGVSLFALLVLIFPISRHRALRSFLAGAVVQAIFGLFQFLLQSVPAATFLGLSPHLPGDVGAGIVASETLGRVLRAYGAFPHPNILGGYLVIALFVLLTHTYIVKTRDIRYLLAVLFSIGIFMSFSRSAVLSLGLLLIGIAPTNRSNTRASVILIIGTLLLSSLIWSPLVLTRTTFHSPHEVASVSERVSGYTEAIALFRSHPLTGVGGGIYTLHARTLFPDRPAWQYQPIHNVILLFIVEYGLIGIILLGNMLWKGRKFFSPGRQIIILWVSLLPIILLDHYPLTSLSFLITILFISVCTVNLKKSHTGDSTLGR